MNDAVLLAGLFVSGFASATVLPGNSEFAFAAYLKTQTAAAWPAWLVVSVGNTLGGLTTVLLGRLAPPPRSAAAWSARLRRFGTPLLALTPLPLAGDVIAAAAGWLRLPLPGVILWSALGRAARYALILYWLK